MNWYVYVNADPVNFVDAWGLDSIHMNYDPSDEELSVIYFHENEDGVFTGQVDTSSYRATNNLPTRQQMPDPVEWPKPTEAGVAPSRFYPKNFPSGTHNITNTQSNHEVMGTVVRTSAQTTHTHQVQDARGNWVDDPTGDTMTDGGFNLHSGTDDVDDYTWGCLRVSDSDMQEIKGMVDEVLDNRPGPTDVHGNYDGQGYQATIHIEKEN